MDLPVRKSSELPAPLKVCKDSHTIVKKPRPANAPRRQARSLPVVIYIASPKVVHATPAEFRSVVQRLTGLSAFSSSNYSSVSRAGSGSQAFGPADCLATLRKAAAKPSTSEEVRTQTAGGGSATLSPPAISPALLHENSSFFFESASNNNLFSSEVAPSPAASYWEHLDLNQYQA
ncbi:protein MKS1-like [Zingiber officinale]|uniref:protein MKS1-like n=1 Tax=Zingiber officinale TaxID=94328 RepID=UPI001C4AB58E|nr:protein MKS1-like [Zingiber officinale]